MRPRLALAAPLLCGLASTYAAPVDAHALLDEPPARDMQDGYKDGSACGISFAQGQPVTSYAAGQTVNVQWLETVDHNGCFLVEFSAGGDQDFQIVGRKSHSSPPPPDAATTAEPRHWSLDVTLPAVACSGCTLRLRQLMLDADVNAADCSATNAAPGSVYTTCANITLTGASGGTAVAPPAAGSGCSMQPAPGHSLGLLAVALGVSLLRRRRRPPGPQVSRR